MKTKSSSKFISKWIQNGIALMIYIILITYILLNTTDNPRYNLILEQKELLLDGLISTLWISVVTLILSMIFGFLFYLMVQSKIQFIKAMAVIFKEIIMGTPLIVMVFLCVYVLGSFINISDKLILGIIALTMYMSPYLANAYQSAIAIVDKDQHIVMNLYHFTGVQKYRYVIFPQIIKPLMPILITNLSSVIKGSALLKIVSISEISYVITVISSKNWAAIEGYLVMWMMYLMITIPLSILAQYIGRKFKYEN
ncbi:MAG: amino acid ABC transporter permease [Cellulosilyticaceae bacterium]